MLTIQPNYMTENDHKTDISNNYKVLNISMLDCNNNVKNISILDCKFHMGNW